MVPRRVMVAAAGLLVFAAAGCGGSSSSSGGGGGSQLVAKVSHAQAEVQGRTVVASAKVKEGGKDVTYYVNDRDGVRIFTAAFREGAARRPLHDDGVGAGRDGDDSLQEADRRHRLPRAFRALRPGRLVPLLR